MAVNAAEYYRSLDDADAYFDVQIFATDWTSATDATKEKGLLAAARALDSLVFKGYKVPIFNLIYNADGTLKSPAPEQSALEAADASQTKKWPRDGLNFAADTPSTVQTLLVFDTTPTAGNYIVTVTLADGITFTTADIAFDADASAIQSAIDTAAALAIADYTAGDIVVAGGPLTTTAATLTFSGSSVSGEAHSTRPVVAASTGFDGTVFTPSGSATITGECPDRVFFAQCEEAIRLIAGHDPQQAYDNSVLSSDGVASTRVSSDVTGESRQHVSHFITSGLAWKYLFAFLDQDNNSFEIERS
jgi:hypothetical protein